MRQDPRHSVVADTGGEAACCAWYGPRMIYRLLADAVLVLHLLFVAFVPAGGLLALRWPRMVFAHLPAAAWGAYISVTGGVCPLTPLENRLRRLGGQSGYDGGFIEHYLLPIIYPGGMTREMQIALAVVVVAVNVGVYGLVWRRWSSRQ